MVVEARRDGIARRIWLGVPMLAVLGCSIADEEVPEVAYSFAVTGLTVPEGTTEIDIAVVLATTLAATENPVSVQVMDVGTGSATAGEDYATFDPITVTFPAGSLTGAIGTATITLLPDTVAEGSDEVLNLSLGQPSSGLAVGQTAFALTLQDAQQAQLQFRLNSSSSPNEANNSYDIDVRLDLTSGATLGFDASALVTDPATGTASSAVDYALFPQTTVEFASGSADGDIQTISIQVIDDTDAEGPESLQLSLSATASGAGIGGAGDHTFTIVDDDGAASPNLAATHGTTGTESALGNGDMLDLGSQTVGAGANAGTRVRISNSGGSAMELGPPILSGSQADDFVVELELAPLPPVGGYGPSAAPSVDVGVPLAGLLADEAAGQAVAVDTSKLAELGNLTRARVHGFPVPGLGEVTLELERIPLPFSDDAVLMVDGQYVPGGPRAVISDITTWRGVALEIPGSRAFVSFSSGSPQGFLELPFEHRRLVHLYTESAPTASTPAICRIVYEEDLIEEVGVTRPTLCGGSLLPPGGSAPGLRVPALGANGGPPNRGTGNNGGAPPLAGITVTDCRLAIETDYQFYQKFNSVPNATDYVTQLIAAISNQYFTDVQTTLSISYLGIYSNSSDPWLEADSGGGTAEVLEEFRSSWSSGGWPASADLAHFISGANLGGGLAYVGVLCNQNYGFGVSGNISGNINWGSWTGQPATFTWDFVVVAHELGHNFGASHTHSYCPPLDECYTNCNSGTTCTQGTIMSYCHSCGGMDNIDLNFHQVIADIMREEVAGSCLNRTSMSPGDYVQYRVRFSPLSSTGARSATLQFSHDAPNTNQPFEVQLSGTGN